MMKGEKWRLGHCVYALEALLSILVLSCSMKASSFINCCFLGWRKSPILVHVILFSVYAQVQKALDVSVLFCFFLTDSISLLMLRPRYSGIHKRRWSWSHYPQKMFMKETKHLVTRQEETRSFHDLLDTVCKTSWGPLDPPQAALLAKTYHWPIDCWDMFLKASGSGQLVPV